MPPTWDLPPAGCQRWAADLPDRIRPAEPVIRLHAVPVAPGMRVAGRVLDSFCLDGGLTEGLTYNNDASARPSNWNDGALNTLSPNSTDTLIMSDQPLGAVLRACRRTCLNYNFSMPTSYEGYQNHPLPQAPNTDLLSNRRCVRIGSCPRALQMREPGYSECLDSVLGEPQEEDGTFRSHCTKPT